MSIPMLMLGTGSSFLFLVLLFTPMEKLYPAKAQPVLRPHWTTDLLFFMGQYLLWGGAVLAVLHLFRGWLDGVMPLGFRQAVSSQPWWLQAVEVVLLSDLFIYWGHRLQHRLPFLWRFHSIHHSAEHLDWLAAHREHPLDTVYTMGLINLPAFLMGFPLETLAGLLAFRGMWAIYIHSNVRLPIGPLRMLIGAPELHHWHHSKERDAGNYANISPLMDLLFGTYRCPDHEPHELGVAEPMPKSYLGQLLHPFRKLKRSQPMLAHACATRVIHVRSSVLPSQTICGERHGSAGSTPLCSELHETCDVETEGKEIPGQVAPGLVLSVRAAGD